MLTHRRNLYVHAAVEDRTSMKICDWMDSLEAPAFNSTLGWDSRLAVKGRVIPPVVAAVQAIREPLENFNPIHSL